MERGTITICHPISRLSWKALENHSVYKTKDPTHIINTKTAIKLFIGKTNLGNALSTLKLENKFIPYSSLTYSIKPLLRELIRTESLVYPPQNIPLQVLVLRF